LVAFVHFEYSVDDASGEVDRLFLFEKKGDRLRCMHESDIAIRRLCYRLNRQGMLELDAWLSRLQKADLNAPGVMMAIETLLQSEAPELQQMMHGEKDIPACLKAWL